MPKRYPLLLLVLLSLLLTACNTVSYYGQAIKGQIRILSLRQPITQLVADPATDDKLRARLQKVEEMRAFASTELGLPDNPSYKTYVDLDRSYVVWNVFAAAEFSLKAKQWCYPVAGCVSYRGYFSEKSARTFAAKLRRKGLDTEVAGVSAYSTLGWFNDPLLNTMLTRSDMQLAGTLFHELAHQRLYVRNDTRFNESFAVAVELEGVRRWLRSCGNEQRYDGYLRSLERKRQFISLVQKTRAKLVTLYASNRPDQKKRIQKVAVFSRLKRDYRLLKKSWNGYRGYDAWFDRKLTNASLVPISSYYDYAPAFQALLQREDSSLSAFYKAADKLAKLAPAERKLALTRLATD